MVSLDTICTHGSDDAPMGWDHSEYLKYRTLLLGEYAWMGDVEWVAEGKYDGMAVVAIMTNSALLLPVIGFVFMIEVFSVIAQLSSKKILKRKIFLAAPIHHHLEASGWPEAKVTMRFWVIGQVAAVAGILLAILGGFAKL